MKSRTKREMVLEIYDREAMGEVTSKEIEVIQLGLLEAFGDGGAMSPAEISRVLLDDDLPVRLDQIFRMGHPFDPYEELFAGLAFSQTTAEAEESIRVIDGHHRRFLATGDRTGVRFARQTAQRARQNALAIGNSQTMSEREKQIQLEIAQWFSIWLQTPDLFQTWLELRKRRPEYQQLT